MSALIIDDEARARRILQALIKEFCNGVTVLATAGSVDEGIEVLQREPVDLIFLDVSMPEKDGFTLAEQPELASIPIVFVTAHAEFALEAFRVNAVDYLLKPVNIQQLRESIARVQRIRSQGKLHGQPSLRFFSEGEHQLIALDDILYLEADGSYSYVRTTRKRYLVSRGLGDFEKKLAISGFFRCHRAYLVNLTHVRKMGSNARAGLMLDTGEEIPVSRYRRSELLASIADSPL